MATFKKSAGILCKAFNLGLIQDNTLSGPLSFICSEASKKTGIGPGRWAAPVCFNGKIPDHLSNAPGMIEAARLIAATGYTLTELCSIQCAYENNGMPAARKGDKVYFGLLSIIKKLGEIHKASREDIAAALLIIEARYEYNLQFS